MDRQERSEEILTGAASAGERQRIVSRPQFVVRHTAARECEFAPHSHSAFTVTSILSGSMLLTIGEAAFELVAGQSAMTNVGEYHSARSSEVEFLSIGIGAGLVNELVAELGLTRTNAEILFRQPVVEDDLLLEMLRSVLVELEGQQVGRGAMLDALVRQVVIHLLRSHL
ncbi:MAG TPA: AraC family ligand binding domain-containing protein, partial [Blastocatellia bacterium]|nr:AraC family ligand binding domain-containing protein [Blastocatellia bacterium]